MKNPSYTCTENTGVPMVPVNHVTADEDERKTGRLHVEEMVWSHRLDGDAN